MLDLYTKLQARLAQEDGQTMAEYAVVLAVIAIGIFAALGFLSGAIGNALALSPATSRNRSTGLFPGPSTELAAALKSSAASLVFR